LNNVIVFTEKGPVSFGDIDENLVKYLSKRPNFDILKLLFSNKTILVEGPTEEMFINSVLSTNAKYLSDIEVISVGHKGFKKYLDIWLKLNKGSTKRKIGIVRDYDNQEKAKADHDKYDQDNENIIVRTTRKYTFEDDLVLIKKNREEISSLFEIGKTSTEVSKYLKEDKASNMFDLTVAIAEGEVEIRPPKHIREVVEWMLK